MPSEVIKAELRHLSSELYKLSDLWNERTHAWSKKQGTRKSSPAWNSAIMVCAEFFNAIEPLNKDSDPRIREWCRRNGTSLSTYDRLKASAVAKFYEKGKLRFSVAGGHLCKMKAEAVEHRCLTMPAYKNLKVKKRKRQEDDKIFLGDEMDVDEAIGDENAPADAEQ